jgi:hypothetical protein
MATLRVSVSLSYDLQRPSLTAAGASYNFKISHLLILSEHDPVILELENLAALKGPGHWKCNTAMREDEHFQDVLEGLRDSIQKE